MTSDQSTIPHLAQSVLLAFALCSCAALDRQGAKRLAEAGEKTTTALSREVNARAANLRDRQFTNDFNYAYSIMQKCRTISAVRGAEAACDVAATAKSRLATPIAQEIRRLANVLVLRRRAIDALGDGYAAFAAEADYDAGADLEKALGGALASVNDLGQALGIAPISNTILSGITLIGGATAREAQRVRLKHGSEALRLIAGQMRLALDKEKGLHSEIDTLVGELDTQTRENLLAADLVPAAPAIEHIVEIAGTPSPGEGRIDAALSAQPALKGAALVAATAQLNSAQRDALTAGISALRALETQHAAFEHGRKVSVGDIADAAAHIVDVLNDGKGK